MVGEDFPLLVTRMKVLAQTGASMTCCSSSEFFGHLTEDNFALVILCHSLQDDVGRRVIQETRRRWPTARVLQMTSLYDRHDGAGADDLTTSNPMTLLKHVTELLRLSKDL
jgi:DNA-binding response OmpR family regulator